MKFMKEAEFGDELLAPRLAKPILSSCINLHVGYHGAKKWQTSQLERKPAALLPGCNRLLPLHDSTASR